MNSIYNNIFDTNWNVKFSDVYQSAETFLNDYNTIGLPITITSENVNTLFYLLYAQYGNSTIANYDLNQFKYKLWSKVFMYGPAWEKRLQIQNELVNLTEAEILAGSFAVHNNAMHDGTDIGIISGVNNNPIIPGINTQNTTRYTKDKITGYATLLDVLESDVTKDFIDKFKKLFRTVLQGDKPLYYETEVED